MKDYNKNVKIVGLYRMSLSGKNDKCILKSDDIVDLAIYKSKIYYIKYSDNGCYLYNISTSGGKSKRMFGNSKAYIESIKIYSDYIYFNYGENIYKAKINSTKKTKVISNAMLKDVSEGYIYYTTQGDDSQSLYKMRIKNKAKTFIKTYTANNRTHILHIYRTYMVYTVIQHIGTLALQPIRHSYGSYSSCDPYSSYGSLAYAAYKLIRHIGAYVSHDAY